MRTIDIQDHELTPWTQAAVQLYSALEAGKHWKKAAATDIEKAVRVHGAQSLELQQHQTSMLLHCTGLAAGNRHQSLAAGDLTWRDHRGREWEWRGT